MRKEQTTKMMRRCPCCVIDFLFVSQLADAELNPAGADIKTIVKEFSLDYKHPCGPLMCWQRNLVHMCDGGDGGWSGGDDGDGCDGYDGTRLQ